jgi:diguanylate cyclase
MKCPKRHWSRLLNHHANTNAFSHSRARATIAFVVWLLSGLAKAVAPLELSDSTRQHDLWPHVQILIDESARESADSIQRADARFVTPQGARSTLGFPGAPVWVRISFTVHPTSDGLWVFDWNYPPLQELDLYVRDAQGTLVATQQMGSLRPFAMRPLQSRTHSALFDLPPGGRYTLYARASSAGAVIAPLSLSKPDRFHAVATREHTLQGLWCGIAALLLFYSVVQYVAVRDTLFLKYALLVCGSLAFSLLFHGLGAQYLWRDWTWLERHLPGIASLTASCGSFLFLEHVLKKPGGNVWFSRVMKGGAALCVVLLVVYCANLMDNRVLTRIISTFGLAPSVIGVPIAIKRGLEGDRTYFLLTLARVGYLVATFITTQVIAGTRDATYLALHVFQLAATFDLLVFLYILSWRTKRAHLSAQRASAEADVMRSLAETDPLTGLANRRALMHALHLGTSGKGKPMTVFLLDLDGFKPVNDRYGHDIGDELLIQMGKRLTSLLRSDDVVARFGGDEFVVIASGINDEASASELGNKMLQAICTPFSLSAGSVSVGLTVGYATYPRDGTSAEALLHAADRAMYEGKVAGKRRVQRAQPVNASLSSTRS